MEAPRPFTSIDGNEGSAHSQATIRPRIFISAAEPSGDLHAASLITAVHQLRPDVDFVGVAGPAMQAAGCHAIFDMTRHSAMLLGVLGNIGRAARLLARVSAEFSTHPYAAAVVVDSPTLNLPIALRARMRAIPTLYYIAPQLWAWGRWRAHQLRARVDKMAVVLPFEQAYFRDLGFDAEYVGHPLFDHLASQTVDSQAVNRIRQAGTPVIAILPGSRRHVIREVLPGQLAVAAAICARMPAAHVGVSVVGDGVAGDIEQLIRAAQIGAQVYPAPNGALLSAADLTLVASGTATLEVAYYGSPMIVMYNGSRWMYHLLGRWLIHTRHLSLLNILANREVVPEFMPYYLSTAVIARRALELLGSAEQLASMRFELKTVLADLIQPGASARAAEVLLELMDGVARISHHGSSRVRKLM